MGSVGSIVMHIREMAQKQEESSFKKALQKHKFSPIYKCEEGEQRENEHLEKEDIKQENADIEEENVEKG
jgi:hypothetical protein